MNSMKVSFILSMCLHLLLLGVGSFLKPKAHFYSPRYTVTLIQEEGREVRPSQIKSRKVTKVEKKPSPKKEKKIKKQEVAKKVYPPEIKKTQPEIKVNKAKVKEERKVEKKEPELDQSSYEEIQKAIAHLKEKKEEEKASLEEQENTESVQKSIRDIQERLLERNIATGIRGEHIVANQNSPYEKSYYGQVWDLIKAKWSVPQEFDKMKDILTVISVTLYRDGSIQDIQFESKSGDPAFDRSALMAIRRVGSFPPFPPGMQMESIEIGIRFSPMEG